MTGRIRLRAFAKVNYAVEVRGLRADGYHEIATVMQNVSLADEVEVERVPGGFELLVEPEGACGPLERNTVYGAWTLLQKLSGGDLPARIRVRKEIPSGAGLGGGSADAAAALYGLNELYGLGLSETELREAGLRIGADVPFCLAGGTALAGGIGEVLTPLPAPPPHHLVIVKPARGADTGEIYRAFDRRQQAGARCVQPVVAALHSGDLRALAGALGNDLAPTTRELVPEVAACERGLLERGALGAIMTGSGTAVYGLFDKRDDARRASQGVGVPFAGAFVPVRSGVEA